jgi:hypothetical protein
MGSFRLALQFELPKRSKNQRSRLARHARKRQHAARDDARRGRLHGNRQYRPPVGHAQRQRRFAHRMRHHQQHLLRGARHRRNHHDAQRHAARQCRKMFLGIPQSARKSQSPITIDGTPFSTSAVNRTALASFVPRPNSARKIPPAMPTGTRSGWQSPAAQPSPQSRSPSRRPLAFTASESA